MIKYLLLSCLLVTAILCTHAQHTMVIRHKYYINTFDTVQGAEILGYYVQTAAHAAIANDKTKKVVRNGAQFTQDPELAKRYQLNFKKIYAAYNKPYSNDLQHRIDKGHINPYTAFAFAEDAADESMYYSNVCPQISFFNEHQWEQVEMYVLKTIAPNYGDTKVWTGVLISTSHPKHIGTLFMPDYYWKVITYTKNGKPVQEAWLGPNKPSNTSTRPADIVITATHLKEVIKQYYPALKLDF